MEKEKKSGELTDEQLGKVSGGFMDLVSEATPFKYVTLQDSASQPIVCPSCGHTHFMSGNMSYKQNGDTFEQLWTYTCMQCGAETQPFGASTCKVTYH